VPLVLLFLAWQTGATRAPVVLFDGRSLDRWTIERAPRAPAAGALPVGVNGALLLTNNDGWIRTTTPYADFRLSLSYRTDRDARATVYFRTWKRLDESGRPQNGYSFPLDDQPVVDPNERWQTLVIECRGDTATIAIDDQPKRVLTDVENSSGYIGLRGEAGVVWVRDILLTPLDRLRSDRLSGERAEPGSGVLLPTLIRDVRAFYTADAMRAGIAGSVRMEVVVREDGSVGDVDVLSSLDRGMDAEATAAVRQWRFQPGTKDGLPVPVIVSVEMTFALQ
jgi:TonB family protein